MEEKIEMKPQIRLSPSSINTFFKCPRSYHYNYIAKLPTKPNIHMVKGSVVHKTLEDFFRGYEPDFKKTLMKLLNKSWAANKIQVKMLELSPEDLLQSKKDCFNIINEYMFSFQRKIKMLIDAGKAENERHAYYLLKPKLKEKYVKDDDLHCCGYIDTVHTDFDGNLTLGDYKTSSKYGVGLPMDYKRQLAIYSLLYERQEKRTADFVAVNFLRYGEEYILEVTPSLLRFARDVICDTYAKTRSVDIGDYPLIEGNLCRWCQFKDVCSGKEDWKELYRQKEVKKALKKKKKEEKK